MVKKTCMTALAMLGIVAAMALMGCSESSDRIVTGPGTPGSGYQLEDYNYGWTDNIYTEGIDYDDPADTDGGETTDGGGGLILGDDKNGNDNDDSGGDGKTEDEFQPDSDVEDESLL